MQIDLNDYEPLGDLLYKVHMEDGTWTKWLKLDELKQLNPHQIKTYITQQHYGKKPK